MTAPVVYGHAMWIIVLAAIAVVGWLLLIRYLNGGQLRSTHNPKVWHERDDRGSGSTRI